MAGIAQANGFLERMGLPKHLKWGFLGVLLFMMGDGIELGWLSPYLVEEGFSVQQTSALFTAYGVTVAVSSWFSGVLVEALGARKTMFLGFLVYVLGTIGFIILGISTFNFSYMMLFYAVRGFGYPLFAFGFLVWISYKTPKEKLGKAVGWFWFAFTGGLGVLGAYYSIWAIDNIGYINTLWSALLWISLGTVFALLFNRDVLVRKKDRNAKEKLQELLKGVTIVKKEPKVFIGGVVRVINTTAQYALPLFFPIYLAAYGIPTSTWLAIWGAIFTSNIAFNLIFGFVGDKFGWRNTVMWFGGVGCGVFTLVMFYAPQVFGGDIWIVGAAGIIWGALLAGYVPLSALVPSLVDKDKGAALSILNLGAGLPLFVGPLLVGVLVGPIGYTGVAWVLAGLYFLSAFLTKFIVLPEEKAYTKPGDLEESGVESAAAAKSGI